jgi:hypothetical protein
MMTMARNHQRSQSEVIFFVCFTRSYKHNTSQSTVTLPSPRPGFPERLANFLNSTTFQLPNHSPTTFQQANGKSSPHHCRETPYVLEVASAPLHFQSNSFLPRMPKSSPSKAAAKVAANVQFVNIPTRKLKPDHPGHALQLRDRLKNLVKTKSCTFFVWEVNYGRVQMWKSITGNNAIEFKNILESMTK